MKKLSPFIQWFVLLLAILLPFFIIRFFPKFHHSYDLRIFREWSEPWQEDWRSIYVNCETCNYPFVGTFLSGGVMSAFDYKNVARVINRFRYYLAVVDGLNVLALWFILTRLHVKNAPFWAGVIGLLPTSWIGSSVWGQIDGMGQSLILLFFILMIWFNAKPRGNGAHYLFFAASGLLLSLMLLTKQLIYFSIGAVGLILLAGMFLYPRPAKVTFISILTAGAAFLLPVMLIDSFLRLKPPYFSHLQYVLATGSQHGDIISSLGFNIWVFFTKDLLGSSHLPLQIGGITLQAVSPYSVGMFLFFAVNIALFFLFFRDLHKSAVTGSQNFNISQLLSALVYFSMVNLTFNLTLTGTHERYLYHFYPFILMACLGLMQRSRFFNKPLLTALFGGALFYSSFLYYYLAGVIRPQNFMMIRVGSAVHLGLFLLLLFVWIRNSNSQTLDATSQT
ncbi:MAG: hypothetical protein JNK32_08745 [Anaerolineales bacterium]|nr:hypothetical protein [Anaerolineales bacterium]